MPKHKDWEDFDDYDDGYNDAEYGYNEEDGDDVVPQPKQAPAKQPHAEGGARRHQLQHAEDQGEARARAEPGTRRSWHAGPARGGRGGLGVRSTGSDVSKCPCQRRGASRGWGPQHVALSRVHF